MARRFYPFLSMQKDSATFDNPALDEVVNALPLYGSYRSLRQLQSVSKETITPFYSPWLDFTPGAGSDVNFTVNPWGSTSDSRDRFALGVRVRFNTISAQVIARAGIDPGEDPGEGWVLNLNSSGQVVIRAAGDRGGASSAAVARTVVGSIRADGRWHIIGLIYNDAAEQLEVFVDDQPQVQASSEFFTSDTSSLSWDTLDMEWGKASGGGQRLDGDIERVVSWNVPVTRQNILDFMRDPLSSIASFSPEFVWLLRENTGTTVSNSGSGVTADGTLGTAVTWAGGSFRSYSGTGITGGIAHFFTGTVEGQEAAPDFDINQGLWTRYGELDPGSAVEVEEGEEPEEFFIQIDEKNPDDSQGLLFTASGSGVSTYETAFENLDDPGVDTNHQVSYRFRFLGKDKADNWKLTTELFEGATKIADLEVHDETNDELEDEDFRQVNAAILSSEAANISDYGNLSFRATAEIEGAEEQSAIPSEDLQNPNRWVNEDGETQNLFQSIGGPPVESTNFVETNSTGAGGTTRYRFALSEVEATNVSAGIALKTTASSEDEGFNLKARVLEDGTEIASRNFGEITDEQEEFVLILSDEEAEELSDLSALQAELIFSASGEPAEGALEFLPTAFDGPKVNATGSIEDLREDDNNTVDVGPAGGRFRVFLSSGPDPGTDLNHQIRLKAHRAGNQAGVSVQLFSSSDMVFDSRDTEGPSGRVLATSEQEEIFEIPKLAAEKITSHANLRLQILTHAGVNGGTGRYDFAALEVPSGRKARVFGCFLEVPPLASIQLSWVRLFIPDQNTADDKGTVRLYAGDARKIYQVDDDEITDVSKVGGYADAGETPRSWDFCSYGENVIATNKVDPVQIRAPGDTEFSDLITSADKPKAAACAVVQRHLLLFNISFVGAPNGQPNEWWCSAFDDPQDFDVSLSTGANRGRIQSSPGEIVAATGGEFALAFKENSIHRLDWVGFGVQSNLEVLASFREQVVTKTDGTIWPRSLVQVGRDVYFLDQDGFKVVLSGQQIRGVGELAVNRTVSDAEFSPRAVKPLDEIGIPEQESTALGAYDPVTGLIWWALRATGGQGRSPDPAWRNGTFLVYNPAEDRWTFLEVEGLTSTLLFGIPQGRETSTSIARGVGAMSIDGNFPVDYDLRFSRFIGNTSYPSRFVTKIWSSKFLTQGEISELFIRHLRPSFRMAPIVSKRPAVEILTEAADDPLMQIAVVPKRVPIDKADPDGWFPIQTSGEFFRFTVEFPELTEQTIREVNGIELDLDFDAER